jgi:AcrR family transcriptional regulator
LVCIGVKRNIPDEPSARRYDSSRRRARAEEGRRRILSAASERFVAHGYASTTLASIASAASVSVPTVYAAFGSKADLLRRCIEVAFAGDDEEQPVAVRPLAVWVHDTDDPRELLARYAAMMATLGRRSGPIYRVLVNAADSDDDLAALLHEFEQQRLRAAAMVVGAIAERGGLAPGLGVDDARDIVWVLNAPELYVTLTDARGWSQSRYQRFVHDALLKLLTAPDEADELRAFEDGGG